MIRSMTGFGKGRAAEGSVALAVQVRSVNARGREVRLRLPSELLEAEEALRQQVQEAVARGRVEVTIDWEGLPPAAPHYALNPAGVATMLAAVAQLREQYGVPGELTAEALLRLPGVVEPVTPAPGDVQALARVAATALGEALAAHAAARAREGARLAADLAARSAAIESLVEEAAGLVADAVPRTAAVLRERVAALLGDVAPAALGADLVEQRLAQEIALAAQRADVTEELVRLRAHMARLKALFAPGATEIGRTLEFLVQEIRREVTTLGAKTGSPEIDQRTLAIRADLERIREQSANLE